MESSERPFCYAPWNSVAISPDGSSGPCCMIPDGYTTEVATPQDLYGLNSANAKKLREALSPSPNFSLDKLHKGCKECFKKDASGIISVRAQYDERESKRHASYPLKKDISPEDILHLDLSLTNICNFKCRYCYTRNSSKWISEKEKLFKIDEKFFRDVIGDSGRIHDTDTEEFVEFASGLKNLRTIEFKGGEPFLSKSHVSILKKLIATGQSSVLSLEYTSNGTIYSSEVSNLWKSFKNVCLSVSMDGIDPVFKYVRSDSTSFAEVWKNFCLYHNDRSAQCNIHITASVYNFLYLPEFVEWLESQNMDIIISIGIVYSPAHLCLHLLDEECIAGVAKQLTKSRFPGISQFGQSLLTSPSRHNEYKPKLDQFWYANEGIDKVRNTNLKETLPQLWSTLKTQ